MDPYFIGFDLGGTKMVAAVLDSQFSILSRVKRKTSSADGAQGILRDILLCLEESLTIAGISAAELAAIGMAVPGLLDRKKGRVVFSPNLAFEDFPLVDEIKKIYSCPVVLENDVNAGLYGEFVQGVAKGFENVLGVFPGTGIGGGLVINGKIYRGFTGNAGEFGHMTIQLEGPRCGCGQLGHVEGMASRTAMAKEAAGLIGGGNIQGKLAEFGTDIKNLSSKFFAQALKEENKLVMEIIDRAADHLGVAIAGSVNLLDPELVVIGGGLVEKLGSYYMKRIEKSVRARAMPMMAQAVQIKQAALGDDAALFGAAQVAKEALLVL